MNTTKDSLSPFPSEQVTSTIRDQLHEGTAPGAEWPTPAESIELLRGLGKSRTQLEERQKELLGIVLDGRGDSLKGELAENMLMQLQAFRQYFELVFGGRIDWELIESLRPLDECNMDYFHRFFQDSCREPRKNLVEWLDDGPLLGRFEGDDRRRCPEVWTLIRMIGVTALNPATIAGVYLHLFNQFPSFPDIEPDTSLPDEENILRAIAVKPTYAIWELQQIAVALGYQT